MGIEINQQRRELVYISFSLMFVSAFLGTFISIFITLKFKYNYKQFITKTAIPILMIIVTSSPFLVYFINIISKEDNRLSISLVANLISNSILFLIVIGNEDTLKFIKNRIRIFKETFVIPSWLGHHMLQNTSTVQATIHGIDDLNLMELNAIPSGMQNTSRSNGDGENQTSQNDLFCSKMIYVVPIADTMT